MKPEEIVKSGYDKIYREYARQRTIWDNKKELDDLVNLLPKHSKILDVGCGAGIPVAKFLINKGFEVVGVDTSKSMLKLAKKNVPEARFYNMNMTKLKFPENTFDAITCFYSISHVPRRYHSKILSKFFRLLKPKGFLLISTGLTETKSYVGDWFGAEMYWSHFDKQTNLKLIKKAKFKIIWHRSVGPKNDRHLFVLTQKT